MNTYVSIASCPDVCPVCKSHARQNVHGELDVHEHIEWMHKTSTPVVQCDGTKTAANLQKLQQAAESRIRLFHEIHEKSYSRKNKGPDPRIFALLEDLKKLREDAL